LKPLLGLVAALSPEAGILPGRRRWRREDGRWIRPIRAAGGADLVCVCAGPGTGNALSAARWLATRGATALVATGVAGGLDPDLSAGDLVVAEEVLSVGDDPGESGPRVDAWRPDAPCIAAAYAALAACGLPVRRGAIATAPHPVLTVRDKDALFGLCRALTVDMESAAVAAAARDSGLPFFVLRGVCDAAGRSVPPDLLDGMAGDGTVRPAALLRRLVRRPSFAADLPRAAMDMGAALAALRLAWRVLFEAGLPGLLASGRPVAAETDGSAEAPCWDDR
jgi:adenosylhomocysteine nucleosidase